MTYNTIGDAVTMQHGAEGALLAGRYRIVRRLGQGGMGSVWLAEDTQLDDKQFAIKMLPSILVSNKRAYRQLKDEALVAMKLTHPNIVTLRAFEENNGNPFLLMDYVDGQTLDDYLAEHLDGLTQRRRDAEGGDGRAASTRPPSGGLPEEEVIRILKPIAAALDYAHGEGVVHRDVKPANIMIRKDGHPFVLDFGIAREIQETMTRMTGALSSGTLPYMSPEQLRGAKPQPAQDVYSFAAMVYECLVGGPPFSRGQIEYQILNETPEPLPGGSQLAASVMAGLAKKPEDRPATCLGVLEGEEECRVESGKCRVGTSPSDASVELQRGRARTPDAPPPVGSRVPRDRVGRDGSTSRPQNGRGKAIAVLALSAALGASVWWWQANEKGTERTTETARTIDASRVSPAPRVPQAHVFPDPSVQPAPSLRLVARIGGREIDGAKVRIGDKDYSTPVKWEKLDGGSRLGPYDVSYESGGKRYFGTFSAVAVDWRGPKEIAVALKEHTGPKHGDEKPLTLPGGATMKMIYVAPGSFMMGSDASDDPRNDDELVGGKNHKVRITKGFWLGKYEVTQDQWQSVMGYDNPSYFKSGNRPVDNVSWEDAQKFIAKVDSAARRQFGGGARLPTEAEWEYACRAGTDTTLPNGENLVVLGGKNGRGLNAIAWYGGNSCKGFELSNGYDCSGWKDKEFPGSKAGTHPVGQKEANNWGFHDMIGNVWEWCNDWYNSDYYKNSPLVDPRGPASGSLRVLRGGSWLSIARGCRSADRDRYDPGLRDDFYGFRLCCSAGPRE